ncbi:hypothetical protein B7C51_08465 [Paenibacillus larvae subsp. pulvifaciens]|uniref:Uncharacterized protein n=1 Tax=Paenibacillus larvae subsp. pulvifaciens TaxID=1477 RepID=A0A1V0URF3_9BACL|nr:hypothetical protein [Paenibacillus larvae]ARF67853.1 hypothetical protein B7C51_08465 [Paenibacillus larvae subsp. pulvifaciens]
MKKWLFMFASMCVAVLIFTMNPGRGFAWYPPDKPGYDEIYISPNDTFQNPTRPKGALHDEVKGFQEVGGKYSILGFYNGRVKDGDKIEIVSPRLGNYILTVHIVQPKPTPQPSTPKPAPVPVEKPKPKPAPAPAEKPKSEGKSNSSKQSAPSASSSSSGTKAKPAPQQSRKAEQSEGSKSKESAHSGSVSKAEEQEPAVEANTANTEKEPVESKENTAGEQTLDHMINKHSLPVEDVTEQAESIQQPALVSEASKPLMSAPQETETPNYGGWICGGIGLFGAIALILFWNPKFRTMVKNKWKKRKTS